MQGGHLTNWCLEQAVGRTSNNRQAESEYILNEKDARYESMIIPQKKYDVSFSPFATLCK
jgi:hypothetical protein